MTELPVRPWDRDRVRFAAGMALIVIAALIAYSPAIRGQVIWDDEQHLTKPELRSVGGLVRIWTEFGATAQYYPLLHTAFWIEHKLWGDSVVGYHVLNILLHCTAAGLLWAILRVLKIPGGFLAACVFALHPVHVESVAWMTEQKNTLSAVFYLASALAYLRFDETRDERSYRWALGLFICGLLSKSVVATLPAALLLVIWWRRGRIDWERDVQPLVKWFVIAIVAGCLTAYLERKLIGAEGAAFELTLLQRLQLSGRVIWFYLAKLFWPSNLIFTYPRWDLSTAPAWHWSFLISAIALVAGLWLMRRRTRGPLVALLFFIGSLVPVLGFLNVFPFKFSFVADHFQYLASIGLIVLASAGVATVLAGRGTAARVAGTVICAGIVITLAALTWRQSRMYSDMKTLYLTTIDRNPGAWLAYNNLGSYYRTRGDNATAREYFERALSLHADIPEALSNVGAIMAEQGHVQEAIPYLKKAVDSQPNSPQMWFNYGTGLAVTGKANDAVAAFERAAELNSEDLDTQMNLASAYASVGRSADAIVTARRALKLARQSGQTALAAQIEQTLSSYDSR